MVDVVAVCDLMRWRPAVLGAILPNECAKRIHTMRCTCSQRQINALVPNLRAESEIRELFTRMDHNGDGLIDLADFLMWEERMEDGKAKTDFWALQEVRSITWERRFRSFPLQIVSRARKLCSLTWEKAIMRFKAHVKLWVRFPALSESMLRRNMA